MVGMSGLFGRHFGILSSFHHCPRSASLSAGSSRGGQFEVES